MPVLIHCPTCAASYKIAEEALGKLGRCKKCGTTFPLVPPTRCEDPATDLDSLAWSAPQHQEDAPAAIGPYRIIREVGRGAMGVVYLAKDPGLDREVALKVPSNLMGHPRARERFLREARTAARFLHPNFCPIYHIGEPEGDPYLVMAFIEGTTLARSVVRGEPWESRRAAELIHTLAHALAEAHRRGVVHRDLKPANIMVDPRGRLFLMDFGLARRIDSVNTISIADGTILGTAAYMPPEQAEGRVKEVGPRSDLYSLGVILYELLAGRPPFSGSLTQVLCQVVNDAPLAPLAPSSRNPAIDAALEAIVLRAMAREPEDRFASMDEFAGALRGWLDAPHPTVPEKDAIVPAATVVPPIPSKVTTSQPNRKPGVAPAPIVARPPVQSPGILTNSLGMKLALIPAGEFLMGSDDTDEIASDDEKPRHRVRITWPFYLGVYPVTQTEYRAVTGQKPSYCKWVDERPVENVSWFDAVAFCNHLSNRESLRPCYRSDGGSIANGDGYRLPTEAEWEYSCRSGSATPYYFGNDPGMLGDHAWFSENSDDETHPVGQKWANAFGLSDMHGNVGEWCSDWYDECFYRQSPIHDPTGPFHARIRNSLDGLWPAMDDSGPGSINLSPPTYWEGFQDASRVIRGGSWSFDSSKCRSAIRSRCRPDDRFINLGFRIVRVRSGK